MKYNKLGRTNIDVSLICLGTMTWGLQNTQDQGFEQMDYALEQGVNFFDTAELYAVPPSEETYGKTETIIGNYFAKRKNRDKIILASKVSGEGIPWIRDGAPISPESIRTALEGSLKRLQTDYIDLYQLHWPNRGSYHFGQYWNYDASGRNNNEVKDDILSTLETLDECIKEGKIRHVGLSNETSWGTMQYLNLSEQQSLPRMVSIQNEYSLLDRKFDTDLGELALHEDIGLLAWSPLATGMLSGKYLNGARPEGARWDYEARIIWRDTKQANLAVKSYCYIATKYNMDICQMALAFVNSRPFLTSNIIGATTMNQLKSNINSINIKLSDEILKDIDEVRKLFPIPY